MALRRRTCPLAHHGSPSPRGQPQMCMGGKHPQGGGELERGWPGVRAVHPDSSLRADRCPVLIFTCVAWLAAPAASPCPMTSPPLGSEGDTPLP